MTATPVKIAILGAGISGLTCAWYLKRRFGDKVSLHIYEKQNRVGGWIRTERIDDFLFEWGPRAFRASDCAEVLSLAQELGLELKEADPIASKRYLLHQGKLEPIPSSFLDLWRSPLSSGLLSALGRDLCASRSKVQDESVFSFFSRRFSSQLAEQFVDPLIKGIYAGNPHQLSMRSCFPYLWDMEQKHRSLILGAFSQSRGQKGLITLKEGLGILPNTLAKALEPNLNLQADIRKIVFNNENVNLQFKNRAESFDYLISAVPAHALAKLIPELATQLEQIPFKSLSVVHLGYKAAVNPYQGFGYLVPSKEKQDILGVIFDSSAFPDPNRAETRLTVMLDKVDDSDALIASSLKYIHKHLGIETRPAVAHAYTAHQAIPQYPVGFHALLQTIQKVKDRRLFLIGPSFNGPSVNQSIKQAKELALTIV